MAIAGTVKSYYKRAQFLVEIDGVASAAFQSASELSAEVAEVQQWEGGAVIANKSPGRVTMTDLTLERGATADKALFLWFSTVVQLTAAGVGSPAFGLPDPLYKRNLDIVQLDRDGIELARWLIAGAWPKKFMAGAWDNTVDENVIESVVLAFDFFERAL